MGKIYRSEVGLLLLLPLILALFAMGILAVLNDIWLGAALPLSGLLFLSYIYFNTSYELTPDRKLKIRSGFFYQKEIYIQSIKRIRNTKNHLASPALSGNRLEIQFNRYESVMVSPRHRKEFIAQLKKVNPAITLVDEKKDLQLWKNKGHSTSQPEVERN